MTDAKTHLYKRKKNRIVTAVQIDLDTDGFSYLKWGGEQRCHARDWLVSSDHDCYTIANDSFLKTYRQVSPGRYEKHTLVQARQADSAGSISTREGQTAYATGDYLIENGADETDTYAISELRFHELYEPVDD